MDTAADHEGRPVRLTPEQFDDLHPRHRPRVRIAILAG